MRTQRSGFSLVEMIIALIILSVGILGMGASTGYVMTQIRISELRTERMAAVREATEQLRATPFSNIGSYCSSTTVTVGRFSVTCQATQPRAGLARVQLTSTGPGYSDGRIVPAVNEVMAMSIIQ